MENRPRASHTGRNLESLDGVSALESDDRDAVGRRVRGLGFGVEVSEQAPVRRDDRVETLSLYYLGGSTARERNFPEHRLALFE